MASKENVVIKRNVEGVEIDGILDRLPQHEADSMCRTIIGGINRLFQDQKYRDDYERWKKAQKRRRTT